MAIGMRDDQLDLVVKGYIEAMLWSSIEDNGYSLDGYSLADGLYDTAKAICQEFIKTAINHPLRPLDHYVTDIRTNTEHNEYEMLGHDLWLTSAGHGTGFWDRDLGDCGEILTELSEKWSRDAYLGDDELVHIY